MLNNVIIWVVDSIDFFEESPGCFLGLFIQGNGFNKGMI